MDQFNRQCQQRALAFAGTAGTPIPYSIPYSNLPCLTIDQRPSLRPYELVVEKLGAQITLDYGSELRLLIADPIKGIELRTAIQHLKTALQKENS